MSASVVTPAGGGSVPAADHPVGPVGPVDDTPAAWFEGLAFEGPLDPGGTLFAFLLALAATVAVVVLVAAAVRVAGLG